MRRKNVALVAATIGGLGVGALFAGPQLAGAATSGSTDTTAPAASSQPSAGPARAGRGSGIEHGQMAVAASKLGMTDADLQTALTGGKTLAQLATDKGISVDSLVTAMLDDMKTKATAAVTAGTITQAQADRNWPTSRPRPPPRSTARARSVTAAAAAEPAWRVARCPWPRPPSA